MPKTKISEFSATPANNTDIDSINIAEGCAPSGINDAIRELMAQLKDFQTGAVGDSFNGPVGTTTPAAGAFTTLSATGNVTLGDASTDTLNVGNGGLIKDASGNLGLGVTPSAWSALKAVQLQNGVSFASYTGNTTPISYVNSGAYFNGTNWIYSVSSAVGNYQINAGVHQWNTAPSGTAGNAITFTQAMTLDASGNLGVGGSSPSTAGTGKIFALQASGSTASQIKLQNGNTGSTSQDGLLIGLDASTSAGYLYNYENAPLIFGTNDAERVRIDSSGLLHVGETAHTDGSMFYSASNSTLNAWRGSSTAGDGVYGAYSNIGGTKTVRAYMRCDGGLANFSANNINISDERLKKDISLAGNYLDKICAIPVKNFRYKDQSASEDITLGVIAQDVLAVAPELVSQEGFGLSDDEKENYFTVYQTDLQYALMKCIQEQQAIIESLKARLDAANL